MECKKCGKKFHACASCGLGNNYEYNYCTVECWKSSQEFLEARALFFSFSITLFKSQREVFKKILNLDSDYELLFEDWLKEVDKMQEQVEKGRWNGEKECDRDCGNCTDEQELV